MKTHTPPAVISTMLFLIALFLVCSPAVHTVRAAGDEHTSPAGADADEWQMEILLKSGENSGQIRHALGHFTADDPRRHGMEFLVRYMPEGDLKTLSAGYLIENVEYAYKAREQFPWARTVPMDIFLNDVLPYASIDERRDPWRRDFFEKFAPMVEGSTSCGEVAQTLNRDMFKVVGVEYHARKRPKPNQSPYESIEAGYASCSGLSVLLIDACRAMGVPARFVGIPRWANKRGNHSWVEIWDDGWHFTGACEYDKRGLDQSWFVGDAAQAIENHPWHAIYASSWKSSGKSFPLIWDLENTTVEALDVTSRYSDGSAKTPENICYISLRQSRRGERIATDIVISKNGAEIARGTTSGASRDLNDVLTLELEKGVPLVASFSLPGENGEKVVINKEFVVPERGIPWINLYVEEQGE
jgi:hypothetical protein